MTEDEAKTKWCPHARKVFPYSEAPAHNREADDAPATKCIASECMAWLREPVVDDRKRGYCGLGGKL